jgi:Flp pilus assembly protein TadG
MNSHWISKNWKQSMKAPILKIKYQPNKKSFYSKVASRQRGITLVEFALVSSLFFLVLFAIFNVCLLFSTYHSVSYAAREATRWASVRGSTCAPTWPSACPASTTDISNYAKNLNIWLNPSALTVTTQWIPNNQPGSQVNVKIQYGYNFSSPFLTTQLITMSAHSQMVISQ